MTDETLIRRNLADKLAKDYESVSKAIILAGSVAYAPNYSVNSNSDVDLIIVPNNLKEIIPIVTSDVKKQTALSHRSFDGYSIKFEEDSIDVSIHFLSSNALEVICKANIANLLLYRPSGKQGTYILGGFEGNTYPYDIKNKFLEDLHEMRTTVPVSFTKGDRYFNGVHRDKLLSNPLILYDSNDFIESNLDSLWKLSVGNLLDESIRLNGSLDLEKFNILNSLAKKDRMSPEVISLIKSKTSHYLNLIK